MLFDRSQLMRYNPSIPNDSPSVGGKMASDWDGCGFLSESRLHCNRLVTLSLIFILSVTGPRTWSLEKAYTHGKTSGATKVATTY
jgi:hypothetical protein